MIISHKHKFIFIKTRKTAGTSVELELSRFCGEDDLIVATTPEDEVLRAEIGGVSPRNYYVSLGDYTGADWKKLLLKMHRSRYYQHMPASEVRARVGEEIWGSYYKFTIERDPWDKALSMYYWRIKDLENKPSFEEFIEDPDLSSGLSNYDLYADDDGVLVDRVIRFDTMVAELDEVAEHVGIGKLGTLPRAKGGHRVKDKVVLSDGQRAKVAEICGREITLLGFGVA